MLTDFRLKAFETVARTGSFTEAARQLGVSQPAISQNVSSLEQMVGESLFDRSNGRVALTPVGTELLSYVSKILFWYERAQAVVIDRTEAPPEKIDLPIGEGRKAEIYLL